MKVKSKLKYRANKSYAKRNNEVKSGKKLDVIEVCWVPPNLPLGQLLEDRYYVLENMKIDNLWLCWDLQEQRETKVKAIDTRHTFEMSSQIDDCSEYFNLNLGDSLENQQEKRDIPESTMETFVDSEIESSLDFTNGLDNSIFNLGNNLKNQQKIHDIPGDTKEESYNSETFLNINDCLGSLNTDLGELLQERFYVLKLVSEEAPKMTVLLCWDLQEKRDVVIKIIKEDKDNVDMTDSDIQTLREEPDNSEMFLNIYDCLGLNTDLGELLQERFYVLKLVSEEAPKMTGLLCWDLQEKRYVVIKIIKEDNGYVDMTDSDIQTLREEPDNSETFLKKNDCLGSLNTDPGELLQERFYVLKLVSEKAPKMTVLLCWDLQEKRYVVIKIIKEDNGYVDMTDSDIQTLREEPDSYSSDKLMDLNFASNSIENTDETQTYLEHYTKNSNYSLDDNSMKGQDTYHAPIEYPVDSAKHLDFASSSMESRDETQTSNDCTDNLNYSLDDNSMNEQATYPAPIEYPVDSATHLANNEGSEEYTEYGEAEVTVKEFLGKCTENIKLGDLIIDRYFVLKSLCKSLMSKILLCWDLQEKRDVVIKMPRETLDDVAMVVNEIEILHVAHERYPTDPRRERIIQILGDFSLDCAKWKVSFAVLEAMDGTLLDLIEKSTKQNIPLVVVKHISRQVLEGLVYLHNCEIFHTDIKPENILYLSGNDSIMRIKIADFGNSCFVNRPLSGEIQTAPYRCPEAILNAGYNTSADIWSVACVIYELATGQILFHINEEDPNARNRLHLEAIIKHLGPIPIQLIERGLNSELYFDQFGKLLHKKKIKHCCIRDDLLNRIGWSFSEAKSFASFMEYMLELDPAKRPTAAECLNHPWFTEDNTT